MSLAKERACGESLSNRVAKRFERKASFARSISDSDYEAARVGAAAKRCAQRGEHYAKHAIRINMGALKRLSSSNSSAMKWAMGGFGSAKSLIYLDWIDEEIAEAVEYTSTKSISGWAPKEKQPYKGATVSSRPWLQSKSSPTRVMRTPKGRYVAAKTAPKQQPRHAPMVAEHPSLPELPRIERRKANPIERLQAKQRIVQAQKRPAAKAIQSLTPSMQASKSVQRLAKLDEQSSKSTSHTPVERLFGTELQQTKSDRQVSPAEIASSRIRKGSSAQKSRGLRPTWKSSPMMQALLSVHEGTDTAQDLAQPAQPQSGVRTVSAWGTPKASVEQAQNRSQAKRASSTRAASRTTLKEEAPTSRLALRTMMDSVNEEQNSVMPVATLEKMTDLLSSNRSQEAYQLFGQAALKNSANRSLIESLRQSSSSALPPVSMQSREAKRLKSRKAPTLNTATQLSDELPQNISSRLKLPWPLTSEDSFRAAEQSASHKSSGLDIVKRRGEASDLEQFAGQIKSSIQPYESNVSLFQPTAAESKRGKTKDLWLMTPSMVVTEPQDQLADIEGVDPVEQSAPRISAWTGAPVSNSPWLSHKKSSSPVKAVRNRLVQQEASRRAGSVLPQISTQQISAQHTEVDRLMVQLPTELKKEWKAVLKQVGSLDVAQHARLKEHVAMTKGQKDLSGSRSLSQTSVRASDRQKTERINQTTGLNAANVARHNATAEMPSTSSTQHAAMRDIVSRQSNPTRGVMTSILGASAVISRPMISQALDAIQKKNTLKKADRASSERFWVDVFRAQLGRNSAGRRPSEMSYGRPDAIVVLPEFSGADNAIASAIASEKAPVKTISAWGESTRASEGNIKAQGRLGALNAQMDSAQSSSPRGTRRLNATTLMGASVDSNAQASEQERSFERALERLDVQNNIGSSQLRQLKPSSLPAWAKGFDIPEAQYLEQMETEAALLNEEGPTGRRSSTGAPVVNGWGSSSRIESMMSGRKQLAYIHKSGQVIPISQAKKAGLPAPKLGARAQLPLGWTLEAVDAQVLNRAMPNWAQRSTERPLIRGTSDMVKALVEARSQEEVIRVIFDRANEPMPELKSLPSTATRFIEQIRKEAHVEQSQAATFSDASDSMTELSSRGRQRRRQSSNVVSGFSGLRAISTAKAQVQETEDRVSKLAKKLQDLVLLAEEKSRKEARQGIRMADNDEAAHNEGAAMSHDDAPNAFSSHDIDAFFQAVIDAYERERDFRKDRDGFEGNSNKNRTTWW